MAQANIIRTDALGTWLDGIVTRTRAAAARRKVFRTTLRELQQLSDRELADLGMHRSCLRSIAWDAARRH